ncbi:IPExxxVDY family protein [Aquimarina sp. 2201CG5-10]|uniref:IPExxxVDY family protein n=1 Tax=Aquimarina callyspongiae TaxID=3098150 RepID=UPI002AB3E100|nr:IPExxxVDY family protein [Aquimarina sp. 2201CG5-10]MDY8135111.1 IPExxxVDY family protein [Aquimarina sp. 2201CG5-10]
MAIQKLVLDTLEDDNYELIAIHCSLESYRLAFLLNKNLDLRLFRKKEDINFDYNPLIASFPLYQYDDQFQYNTYYLIGNKFKTKVESDTKISDGLFADTRENYVTKYLVPELKNVDYFLKIDTETSEFSIKSLLSSLTNISQVITAYAVEYNELKSKNNLILD